MSSIFEAKCAPAMTVSALRRALRGIDGDCHILVRVDVAGGSDPTASLRLAGLQANGDQGVAFVLHGSMPYDTREDRLAELEALESAKRSDDEEPRS